MWGVKCVSRAQSAHRIVGTNGSLGSTATNFASIAHAEPISNLHRNYDFERIAKAVGLCKKTQLTADM